MPAAVPGDLQMQNPVAAFLPDADGIVDNNGSVIMMPAVPDLGASVVRGRLVFGIGTRANNQIPLTAHVYPVDTNPANDTYLSLGTSAADSPTRAAISTAARTRCSSTTRASA